MDLAQQVGAYVGAASFIGLAIFVPLFVSQARDIRRLRAWSDREPAAAEEAERVAVASARLAQQAAIARATGEAEATRAEVEGGGGNGEPRGARGRGSARDHADHRRTSRDRRGAGVEAVAEWWTRRTPARVDRGGGVRARARGGPRISPADRRRRRHRIESPADGRAGRGGEGGRRGGGAQRDRGPGPRRKGRRRRRDERVRAGGRDQQRRTRGGALRCCSSAVSEDAASAVASDLGVQSVEPIDSGSSALADGADVVVIAGEDRAQL